MSDKAPSTLIELSKLESIEVKASDDGIELTLDRHADHGSWRGSMRLRPRDIDALEAALHTHGSLADLAPDTERTLALEALTALTGSTGNLVFLARRAVTRDKNLSARVAWLEAEHIKLSRANDSRNERCIAVLGNLIREVSEGDGSVPKVLEALEARAANTALMAAIAALKRLKNEEDGC